MQDFRLKVEKIFCDTCRSGLPMQCTGAVSMVLQCKLVSGCGLRMKETDIGA